MSSIIGCLKSAYLGVRVSLACNASYSHNIDSASLDESDAAAVALAKKVRILCWIMTSPSNLNEKAIHVYKTWASRCNKVLFMSSEKNQTEFPAPVISE